MATIWIDGVSYEADPSRNLLAVILELGFDLPYFCWHPALGSIGACRQCAITQFRGEDDHQGQVVMACMTPAAEGARVSIDHASAATLRKSVIEWLMVSHPHDCPVCDEGGECHLQDMTVMAGHTYRRSRLPKRTYISQDLGPLIGHEMNRCIQCYRCVRFYREYAGGHDLQAMGTRDRIYFGRYQDGPLESEFAGNLVEICPTGVFTDKTQARHYTRKWDLQTAPSICTHCGVGCNINPGERYGALRRVRARYHGAVNGYFLCDRGRYGYEFESSDRRIRVPLAPRGEQNQAEELSVQAAVTRVAKILTSSRRVIGVGSPRATIESNYALQRLVGADGFFHAACAEEHRSSLAALDALREGPSRSPALREIERCDAVVVLGEDLTQSAPMMALAIRQAALAIPRSVAERQGIPPWHDAAIRESVQSARGPVFLLSPAPTKLDDLATRVYRKTPRAIAAAGQAIARALDPQVPALAGDEMDRAGIEEIARALTVAERPLVVAGSGTASEAVINAAANLAWATSAAREDDRAAELAYALPWANSAGLSLLGGAPLDEALAAAERGEVDAAIILESDLDRIAGPGPAERFLGQVRHAVVLDHIAHPTAARADVVLPAATFAEGHGHLVNSEGRAQRQMAVFSPDEPIRESWRWLREAMMLAGYDEADSWTGAEAIAEAAARDHPALARLPDAQLSADFRLGGAKVARAPHRYSGRAAAKLHLNVLEPTPPRDNDSPLEFSMEGSPVLPPGKIETTFWAPGWSSPQALTRFQEEIDGPLRGGDPGVRLIEPAGEPFAYRDVALSAPSPELAPTPVVAAFGSEELSALAPGIAALAPRAFLELNPRDAASLGLADDDVVSVRARGASARLSVRLEPGRAQGTAGIPLGLEDIPVALSFAGELITGS